MQLLLETVLYAELADVVGAAVVALVLAVFNGFLFSLVDAADVAHHMTAEFAKRVISKQPGLDVNTRKAVALGGEARHLFISQSGAQRNRFEGSGLLAQALEASLVARLNVHDLLQLGNRRVQISHLGRRDFQREGRVVRCQHNAVAVQNHAAIGHDGNNRRAVVFSLIGQVGVPVHLQINQPRRHQ